MNSNRTPSKLKINLFGENIVVRKVLLSEEDNLLYTKVAGKMDQPLSQTLVDPFFYHLLKNPQINSLDDLKCEYWEGLINNPKNQIEIWFQNKKIQKFKIDVLIKELLLFPLFQTTITPPIDVSKSGIYIQQKEVGLVNSFEMLLDNFNIDLLLFEISDYQEITHLSDIKYNSLSIPKKRKDTLITYQNGFKVD